MLNLIIKNAEIWHQNSLIKADLGIQDQQIAFIGSIPLSKINSNTQVINAKGLCIFPGSIDTQVHFRDPGMPHKETLYTGTKSAILGGVTSIFDMPNTNPNTVTEATLKQKVQNAEKNSFCHFAFYIGGTPEKRNWKRLEKLPGCCGIKVFMGSSTGNLLVDRKKDITDILLNSNRRIAFHSENEDRLKQRKIIAKNAKEVHFHPIWRDTQTALTSTQMVLKLAKKYNHPIHILHVTTQEEMMLLKHFKNIASVEVTPQHLTFNSNDYKTLGTRIQMNPPIRKKHHQEMLWQAVNQNIVSIIGSDHAPHTLTEKAETYPNSPSGMPGVQTTVPVMFTHLKNQKLSLKTLTKLLMHQPAQLFNIQNKGFIELGFDADLVGIDLNQSYTIRDEQMAYQCGWTPFDGFLSKAKVNFTVLNGQLIMQDQQIIGKPSGKQIHFKTH